MAPSIGVDMMASSNQPLPTKLKAKPISPEPKFDAISVSCAEFPSLEGSDSSPLSRKVALGAWGSVNRLVGHTPSKVVSNSARPGSCAEQHDEPRTSIEAPSSAGSERETRRGGSTDPSRQASTPSPAGQCNEQRATHEIDTQQSAIHVPPSAAQVKTAAVLEAVRECCTSLLCNFSVNYTSGLTRLETGAAQVSAKNLAYARQLARCEPVIFGGFAYAMLRKAVGCGAEVASAADPFRPTTDIDIKVPFPTAASRKKKDGWHQFTHPSATRAFEVAQDRVLEMVEMLNMSSQKHIEALAAKDIHLMQQGACQMGALAGRGFIDVDFLHLLARKRPSSRYDHVFPSPAGFGPFFTSFCYNERLVFYTFKVCYVWSSPDVESGEPQYAELMELQMVPKEAVKKSGSLAITAQAQAGFELRLRENLNRSDWPSLDGEKPSEQRVEHEGICMRWTSNILRSEADQTSPTQDARGKVCIEDPSSLAKASARAVTNRIARGCSKDGDWEKVATDQRRLQWLRSVANAKALEALHVTAEVQERTSRECENILSLRIQKK